MVPPKSSSIKAKLKKLPVKPLVLIHPPLPTPSQTEAVFNIVKRSILKNAKREKRHLSALALREEIHRAMSKWPKQNWPRTEKGIIKKQARK